MNIVFSRRACLWAALSMLGVIVGGGVVPGQDALGTIREVGQPGKFHALLEPLEGRWEVRIYYRLKPGAAPERVRGVAEFEWILGGRFLRQTVDGKGAAGAYEGLGLLGHDNVIGKYVGVFADSMDSSLTFSEGRVSSGGNVFSFEVERSSTSSGRREKLKGRLEIQTTRSLLYQVFDDGGKEVLRIEYRRK